MYKKILFGVLTLSLSVALVSSVAYGQSSTTTIERTTTQTKTPRVHKKAIPASTTTTSVTTVRTAEPRQVLSQDMLKKNSSTICASGFKSYIGNERKNVCQGRATAPDLAYSCVWDSKGVEAYTPDKKGPCSLDFAEHIGNVVITKSDYKSSPPLKYGVEAQCCFRAAKSPIASN